MERLISHFRKLIEETPTEFLRYAYSQINWNNRMIGLTGPRGVGKTTMVLQYIKSNLPIEESLYVTAEDFYFADHKLVDLVDEFVKYGGKYIFIDEIHKYSGWSRELKLIYDYHPKLKIVFTGSSVLDINKGDSDLSRRAVMYSMQGLSFREYLIMFHNYSIDVYSLEQVLGHKVNIEELKHPLPLFDEYLRNGYYPFSREDDYNIKLRQVINQTLETDIPQYADMNVSTGRKFKHLLAIIANSVPFKPNASSIATALSVSRNSVADYCQYIEEAGLISQLRDATGGIRGLGKVNKIYLDNPNLIYSLAGNSSNIGNIRETFFMNQTRVVSEVIASSQADFTIGDKTFEVGGKKKGHKQIKGIDHGYIVKDGIEFGFGNTIPLWQFGFLY